MCREGAWFELTVEVTSVGKLTKPTARFFIAVNNYHVWGKRDYLLPRLHVMIVVCKCNPDI